MSQELVDNILNEALNILKNSKELRDQLNLITTTATFTPDIISSAILAQLNFTYADNTIKYPAWALLEEKDRKWIITYIERASKVVNNRLLQEYKNIIGKFPRIQIEVDGTKENFTVSVTVNEDDPRPFAKAWRGREIDIGPFQAIKEGYRDTMKSVWARIKEKIIEKDKRKERNKEEENKNWNQSANDLEHIFGDTVADRTVSSAMNSLGKKINERKENSAKQIFLELGLEVYIEYISTKEETNIEVFLGSSSRNRQQAAKEKAIIKQAKDALSIALSDAFLQKRKDIGISWGGSDSRVTIEKKKIVKHFIDEINKIKNAKVKVLKTIDTKPKLSKRKSKRKKISKKIKNKNIKTTFSSNPQNKSLGINKKSGKSSTINLNALKAQINARLSMTVIKNMGTPALENRTGRFARSVQVTDVIQSSKGFPSIGYSYQKFPYQTFEPGFKQGSAERDPRKVIDRSIREIAQELIVGRFYTRRV